MLAIIADDLTGALDSAAPFAGRGLHTEVALSLDAVPAAIDAGPSVVVINLASREVAPEQAARLTREALAHLPRGVRIFKKIDSRLKGNITAELDAMEYDCCLVAPAIPEFSRIVRNGHLEGFGVEVPIGIADRLGAHAGRATIPDIASQEDMRTGLDAALKEDIDLLIGARGLADALAQTLSGIENATLSPMPDAPALFVIGSRDPITVAQIDELRASTSMTYIAAPNGAIKGSVAAAKGLTLVQATPGTAPANPAEVSENLATSVVPALTDPAATLLISGGATAETVLKRMGVTRFRLMGECVPGLGLAYADGRCIITKSGGFGQPDTLKTIAKQILEKME